MSAPAPQSQTLGSVAYEQFYGFVQSPFTLTPDPRFLYRSGSHEEAITLLLQALRRKEGFIVLTGDIGTGKTTICRALLQQLDSTTFTSLILNPFLSVEELLREALLDFGVMSREAARSGRVATASTHELVSALHEFLLSLVPINGSAILIIDEAQHLTAQVLEQIRVLSNLETNESKLLQIVLVGQLNLLDMLSGAEMRQLDQRVSIRATLKPLTRAEVEAYIGHRLWVARGSTAVTFDGPALDRVHRFTGGVPRIINLLCDRVLMKAAMARLADIDAELVDQGAASLGLALPAAPKRHLGLNLKAPRWVLATAAAVIALAGVLMFAPIDRFFDTTPPPAPKAPVLRGAVAGGPKRVPTADLMLPPAIVPPPTAAPARQGATPAERTPAATRPPAPAPAAPAPAVPPAGTPPGFINQQ